jgi:PGF-pre-PGF domain-containing protein
MQDSMWEVMDGGCLMQRAKLTSGGISPWLFVCLAVVSILFFPFSSGAIVSESTGTLSSEFNSGYFTITFLNRESVPPGITSTSVTDTTTSTATIRVDTNESANLTIRYGISQPMGSVNAITSFATTNILTLTGLSAGTTYYYNVTVCDQQGNCAYGSTTTFTTDSAAVVASPSAPSGGGGGGGYSGGGGGSGLLTSNVASRFSRFWDRLEAGPVSFLVDIADMAITRVEFMLTEAVDNVNFEITRLYSYPTGIPDISVLYQLYEITVSNVDNSMLTNVYITFEVEDEWLDVNQIEPGSVAMYRFSEGVWKGLPTTRIGASDGKTIFRTRTPGFSYFAIAGRSTAKEVVPVPVTPTQPPTTPVVPTPEPVVPGVEPTPVVPGVEPAPVPAPFLATYGIWLLIFAVVFIASLYLLLRPKKVNTKGLSLYYYTELDKKLHFTTRNNWVLKSIYDLRNALSNMDPQTFAFHVAAGKNDFARWVRAAFGDISLARGMMKTANKEVMLNLVNSKIDFLENRARDLSFSQKHDLEKKAIQDLFNYIESSKKGGASNPHIYHALSNAGWKEDAIVEALYGPTGPILKNISDLKNPVDRNKKRINDYIQRSLTKRVHKDIIVEQLLKAGWPLEMVESEMQNYFKKD